MAEFCIATQMQPSEFKKLTLLEYMEFLKVLDKAGDEL
jgi:hypothetical protein